jgi:hypothetical protein
MILPSVIPGGSEFSFKPINSIPKKSRKVRKARKEVFS